MKNTQELRAFLTAQMNGVATGELDCERAKGVSNLAQQIYNTLNVEIKMAMAKAKLGDQEIEPVRFDE